MTLDELYEEVKELKDQNVPGDTEVFIFNANHDDEWTECSYVSAWEEKSPDGEKDRFIEIG